MYGEKGEENGVVLAECGACADCCSLVPRVFVLAVH